MSNAQFNAGTRSQPLGDPKAGVSGDLDALAAYVGSLEQRSSHSPHRNAAGALTATGAAGRDGVRGAGCAACHGGTAFTEARRRRAAEHRHAQAVERQPLGAALTGIDIPTLRDVWADRARTCTTALHRRWRRPSRRTAG